MDCHTQTEIHGTDTEHQTMFDEGVMEVSCDNEGCHAPATLVDNTAHSIHRDAVYCNACHAKTVVACYNGHFETELAIDKKRFYGPPPFNGFALLVRDARRNKVSTASFQSVTYKETTFYAIGPFNGHTIGREARACADCHDSEIVRQYNNATGTIPVVQWDASQGRLVNTKGAIPVPPDWQQALLMDYVRFKGAPSDAITSPLDPTQWEFMKSGADLSQMLLAEPLTAEQMNKLAVQITALEGEPGIPDRFELRQNYPNPFNPTTTVEFYLHQPAEVTLKVYNLLGEEVMTVMASRGLGRGVHTATVDARALASGTYVYRLESPEFNLARTMTVVK